MNMKRIMPVLLAGALCAHAGNNVYTGNAGDNDFNNSANWWNAVDPTDTLFFRGDNIAANPTWANPALSSQATVANIKFQQSPGAAYTISGQQLTIDGSGATQTTLIEMLSGATYNQTFANSVVLSSINNANNRHIKTTGSGTLEFSGTLSQAGSSAGLGIGLDDGNVTVSGNIDGSSKLWKIHNDGGSGIMTFSGSGSWSGSGTFQVSTGAEVLLARDTTDSSGFAPGVLQLLGGSLALGNDEQIMDTVDVNFAAAVGLFDLDGYEETVNSLKFVNAVHAGTLNMGDGGVLRLDNQDSAATWGLLQIDEWDSGSDHIYVDGGSFSASQLASITFDGWDAGAKVEGGELLPAAIPEPATLGMLVLSFLALFGYRRVLNM